MKRFFKHVAILFLAAGCLDPYNVPPIKSEKQYLVVDGFLSDSNTAIRLSRSMNLDDAFAPTEKGATVQIEGDDGAIYDLTETTTGSYTAASLPVAEGKSYRLRIKTTSQSEYVSDFVPYKKTPPIDSLFWTYKNKDVDILLNTHDDNKSSIYYMWRWSETWNYRTNFVSTVKVVGSTIVQRAPNEFINNCWKTNHSTAILLANTARLEHDIVSNYLVMPIALTSERFLLKYSIAVEEFALTKDAYDYWQQLKKNTEEIGSIFGPQPSQIVSNIHGVTDPTELIVGYFSACSPTKKRIFIRNEDLIRARPSNPYIECRADTLFLKDIGFSSGSELLITEAFRGTALIGYLRSDFFCVDCTLHGGTTEKPDFWE